MRQPQGANNGPGGVAYLDGALWQRLSNAETREDFQNAWIALQCAQIPGVERAVLVARNNGPFRPAAFWPDRKATSRFLMQTVEEALSKRVNQVADAPDGNSAAIALLMRRDGEAVAVIAAEVSRRSPAEMQTALRQLQWGAGWFEAYLRRDSSASDNQAIERLTLALDAIAIAGEHDGFRAAATAALSEMSVQLSAARIAFGTRATRGCKVRAVSNVTQFDKRVKVVRSVAEAMNEATDQAQLVSHPAMAEEALGVVSSKAEALSGERDGGQVISVPFARDGKAVGAFVFEWTADEPPKPHLSDAVGDVAALLGPLLYDRLKEERWLSTKFFSVAAAHLGRLLGPSYLGRKVFALILVGLVAFFAWYKTDFRVAADARLRGQVERVVVAPIDGYVIEAAPRAGDRVQEGDALVRLDDVEFQLERYSWTARKHQFETEYAQALASFDRAGTNILRARIEEAEAQIELNETRIALTRVHAPFDALVVSGDLSQQLGRAVQQGEELFRLTPLDDYRLRIEVDEGDITYIEQGQTGSLVLSSLPDDTFPFTVDKVTPVTGAAEGRNYFVIEAVLDESAGRPLRPGMEGIAKIETGEARLIWIWTRKRIDWARLIGWRWAP